MLSSACQRARYVAALSVDEAPSQLDARALARHLERCAECRAFAETVSGFTHQVREADLHAIELRLTPDRPRRLGRLIPRSIPAAVIATAAVVGGVAFAVASHEALKPHQQLPRSLPALVIDVSGADTNRETQRFLQGVRDASLVRTVGAPRRGAPERPGIQVG
jgi:hypothetical protein